MRCFDNIFKICAMSISWHVHKDKITIDIGYFSSVVRATMLDLNFSDSLSKLNFIGVVSLFGGEIALSALRYSVLIPNVYLSLYVTMILSPGLQTVSLKMFRRMQGKISRAISGGDGEDMKTIVGLSASGKYRYIGLHSGTKMVVSSVLGEALIRAYDAGNPIPVICTRKNSPKRGLTLKVIKLGKLEVEKANGSSDEYGSRIYAIDELFTRRKVVIYTIPLITIAGIVISALIEDYMSFVLILLNVLCNMAVTFTVRSNGIRYPIGKSSDHSPAGDIFVESDDSSKIYLVMGDENSIQYLFQKPLVVLPKPEDKLWNFLHTLAAYSSYVMVVVNIILLPFCAIGGQIIFGALIFFGVVQNIFLSTFDGDELLLTTTKQLFKIEHAKEYIFQTRSSAISFCMLECRSADVRPLQHLLPRTETYESWFEHVAKNVRSRHGIVVDGGVNHGLLGDLDKGFDDALKQHIISSEPTKEAFGIVTHQCP